jgi:hypothetical protein
MVEVVFSSFLTISRGLRQKLVVQTNVRISGALQGVSYLGGRSQ